MTRIRLGIRENLAQFALLLLVNAFVGATVGMERAILPALAEREFQLVAKSAVLSFIVVFGISKALTNYLAGSFADRFGRKHVLIAGWLVSAQARSRHGMQRVCRVSNDSNANRAALDRIRARLAAGVAPRKIFVAWSSWIE